MCVYVCLLNFIRNIYLFILKYLKDHDFYICFLYFYYKAVMLGKPRQSKQECRPRPLKSSGTSTLVEGNKPKSGTSRSFRARTIAPHQLHGCLINRVELFYDTGCVTIIINCTPHRYPCCSD